MCLVSHSPCSCWCIKSILSEDDSSILPIQSVASQRLVNCASGRPRQTGGVVRSFRMSPVPFNLSLMRYSWKCRPTAMLRLVGHLNTETELDQMAAALEAGANEYVMKPFTKEILVEKLQLVGIHP